MRLKASGKFEIKNGFLRVVLDSDFCRYYKWLFDKAHFHTIKTQLPKHGAHINIVSAKIHKGVDVSKYKKLNGKRIEFKYDIRGNIGGFTKGFRNFWFDVHSKELVRLAQDLGVFKASSKFAPFHITILNTKNL